MNVPNESVLALLDSHADARVTDAGPDRLARVVDRFCDALLAEFGPRIDRQAKGFRRRVLAMIARRLPPRRKSPGRPRLRRVTLAVQAYVRQRDEVTIGSRKRIDWLHIARDCDPQFAAIKCEYRRRIALKRIRDAVHARLQSS